MIFTAQTTFLANLYLDKPEKAIRANFTQYSYLCSVIVSQQSSLTLWEPAYNIFVLQFRPKTQQFSVTLPTP